MIKSTKKKIKEMNTQLEAYAEELNSVKLEKLELKKEIDFLTTCCKNILTAQPKDKQYIMFNDGGNYVGFIFTAGPYDSRLDRLTFYCPNPEVIYSDNKVIVVRSIATAEKGDRMFVVDRSSKHVTEVTSSVEWFMNNTSTINIKVK